ncbi:MAG: SelT/SelW/SelH family protein [Gemmatimonadaceae bacterium]
MAAEIRQRFPDSEITLIKSRGGRFEVTVDGKPIYEKSKTGRHAKPGEILSLLEQKS